MKESNNGFRLTSSNKTLRCKYSYKANVEAFTVKSISWDDVIELFTPSGGKLIYRHRQTAAVIRTRERKFTNDTL